MSGLGGGRHHLPRWLRVRRGLARYWGLEGPEHLSWLDEEAPHEHTVLGAAVAAVLVLAGGGVAGALVLG
jgi:hypothetical protein